MLDPHQTPDFSKVESLVNKFQQQYLNVSVDSSQFSSSGPSWFSFGKSKDPLEVKIDSLWFSSDFSECEVKYYLNFDDEADVKSHDDDLYTICSQNEGKIKTLIQKKINSGQTRVKSVSLEQGSLIVFISIVVYSNANIVAIIAAIATLFTALTGLLKEFRKLITALKN